MALSKSFETRFGLTAENAYAKISRISGDKNVLDIQVDWYASQEARDAGTPVLHTQYYSWPGIHADELTEAAYLFIKTLPDFESATDV